VSFRKKKKNDPARLDHPNHHPSAYTAPHVVGKLLRTRITAAQHQVEGRIVLNAAVRHGAKVLDLKAHINKGLLAGGDALLVLDLLLRVLDGVGGLQIEGDVLAGKGLDEYLHGEKKAVQAGKLSGWWVAVRGGGGGKAVSHMRVVVQKA